MGALSIQSNRSLIGSGLLPIYASKKHNTYGTPVQREIRNVEIRAGPISDIPMMHSMPLCRTIRIPVRRIIKTLRSK
jgi:hypothetical protein